MFCPQCQTEARKFGKNRNGSQRYRCDDCRKTFTDETTSTDRRCLPEEKHVMCLRMLLEGNSIRSTERLTCVNRNTIMWAMVEAGRACEAWLAKIIKDVPAQDIEADEIWGFVRCKEKTKHRKGYGDEFGDCYCYVAIERTNKLVMAYHVGRRNPHSTGEFAKKLDDAVGGWFQLSTDGYPPYRLAIRATFGNYIDYGQMVKLFGQAPAVGATRYSPVEIIGYYKQVVIGTPNEDRICTSHAERKNLSIRMGIRRMTRLTNAHSKKLANHEAAFGLWFAYYNFCRVHETLTDATRSADQPKRKTTPAMAAGLTDHVWSVNELLRHVNAR